MKKSNSRTIEKISKILKKTYNNKVLSNLDHFSGFYQIFGYKNPILISGVDGVGTKLRLALDYEKYNIIGIDCFAMCINDVLCHGATPLFFLDYLACGKLDSYIVEKILHGIAFSCKKNNTCFIGGETAEMPGIYQENDYDVAGFCVGIAEKNKIIDGKKLIQEGDILIGLSSSGVHSNGFSLIRNIFSKNDFLTDFENQPLFETLLEPTKIYYSSIHILFKEFDIHGIAHITGGGILDNVSRIIPDNLSSVIIKEKIPIQSIFNYIQKKGNLLEKEMWNTFNMGVGMILVIPINQKNSILHRLRMLGEHPFILGYIVNIKNTDQKVFLK
ncbi:phosphoribosylformylglycinamidine cyclo-ligase [Blattabacterium cuenoti]|uniref:phosphoribosylformylglycinamidine cyclo-ligase n=1 Tax=Blattabacterium cuenoti TaxID=1653831 RepID=UPI00163BEF56|nr:phosphoribosylformylglycinamidine cyclo-ligase [Blattabacterium cuenoti]